jgi:hypothetical protein
MRKVIDDDARIDAVAFDEPILALRAVDASLVRRGAAAAVCIARRYLKKRLNQLL